MNRLRTLAIAETAALLRTQAFLVAAGAALVLATLMLPAPGASYATLTYGGRPGLLSGGFAGTACGALMTSLFGLLALFVAGTSLARDRKNGFGRLLATLPVSRVSIVLSRALAAFTALTIVALTAGLLVALEGTARSGTAFDSSAFFLRYVPIVVPGLAVFAAIATIVDALAPSRPALRVALALSAWTAIVMCSTIPAIGSFDPNGFRSIQDDAARTLGGAGGWSIGFVGVRPGAIPFHWSGIDTNASFLWARAALAIGGFFVAGVAALRFDRFAVVAHGVVAVQTSFGLIRIPRLSVLTPGRGTRLIARIGADVRYAVGAHRSTALAALGLAIVAALTVSSSQQLAKILICFDALVVARLVETGELGVAHDRLLQTIAGCTRHWVAWKFATIAIATGALAAPVLALVALRSGVLAATTLAVAISVIAAMHAVCARISGGPILGTVVTFVWWYATTLTPAPPAVDVAAVSNAPSWYVCCAAGIMVVAAAGWQELRLQVWDRPRRSA